MMSCSEFSARSRRNRMRSKAALSHPCCFSLRSLCVRYRARSLPLGGERVVVERSGPSGSAIGTSRPEWQCHPHEAAHSGPSGSAGRGDLWTLWALRQRWDASGRGVLRISPEDNPFAGGDPFAGRTISRLVKLMCSTSPQVVWISTREARPACHPPFGGLN